MVSAGTPTSQLKSSSPFLVVPSTTADIAPRISVVVPVYNEQESLPELCKRISDTIDTMGLAGKFEILLVDDGSTDQSAGEIEKLAEQTDFVKGVICRYNRGKSLALMTGFTLASGDYVVTLDADLQDNPEDIPLLLAKLDEGFDLVNGFRERRNDGWLRKYGSRFFNWGVRRASGLELRDMNCGFKAMKLKVARELLVFGQYHRFIPLLAFLNGFRVTEVLVRNSKRKYGSSKYTAVRYQGLFDLLSILFTYKHSFSPLHLFGSISLVLAIPSLLLLLFFATEHLFFLLGFGKELFVRPMLLFASQTLLLSLNIFLIGFVCDFMLHHSVRNNIDAILHNNIKSLYDKRAQPTPRAEKP